MVMKWEIFVFGNLKEMLLIWIIKIIKSWKWTYFREENQSGNESLSDYTFEWKKSRK
jgi:hypothetical protein